MTEQKIIKSLFNFANDKGHKYMCSNTMCIPGVGEADFLSVNKSLFITEYEIKVSKSDFKADFRNKVAKHKRMVGELISRRKWTGHCKTTNEGIYEEWEEIQKPFVNYFFFVCPKDLISIEEVPDYAGLIYAEEISMNYKDYTRVICTQIKKPKRFHMDKVSDKVLLDMYRSVMYKYYK